MLDRRLFANFDWVLLSIVLMLCAVGIVAMYSATMGSPQLGRFCQDKSFGWGWDDTRANSNGDRLPNLGTVRAIPSSWCGLSTDTGTVYRYRWACSPVERWLQVGPVFVQPSSLPS